MQRGYHRPPACLSLPEGHSLVRVPLRARFLLFYARALSRNLGALLYKIGSIGAFLGDHVTAILMNICTSSVWRVPEPLALDPFRRTPFSIFILSVAICRRFWFRYLESRCVASFPFFMKILT